MIIQSKRTLLPKSDGANNTPISYDRMNNCVPFFCTYKEKEANKEKEAKKEEENVALEWKGRGMKRNEERMKKNEEE
jgi:hypothetical protein